VTERLWGQIVTPDYFETLKAGAAAGRVFSTSDNSTGAADVIISEGYWQRQLGGSPDVIGQTLSVNGQSATIIGVAAKDFIGASPLTSAAEIWISANATPRLAPELAAPVMRDPRQLDFHLLGRLKQGVTPSQAEAQLDVIAKELSKEKDETVANVNQGRLITLVPGGQLFPLRKEDLPAGLALPVAFESLLLLLACTNASTLLLAKAGNRRREITIRAALGASRRRLIKQLLTESLILGICSGIVGLGLGLFLNIQSQRTIANVFPPYIRLDFSLGLPAVALALGISLFSGLLFGIVPALRSSRLDLLSGLGAGNSWFLSGYRWFSSRNVLIVLQVASSTTVVILVGIIISGYQRATSTAEFGFEPHDLYTFSIDPLREGYSAEQASDFLKAIPDKLRQMPGIADASVAENPPIGDLFFRTVGSRLAPPMRSQPAYVRSGDGKRSLGRVLEEHVGFGYFETLSVRPLRGRVFANQDRDQQQPTIVINAALAKTAWPTEDPIGRELELGNQSYEVIGVVHDFRTNGLLANTPPVAFRLLGLEAITTPSLQGMTVLVRGQRGASLLPELKPGVAGIDPNLNVFNAALQDERLSQVLSLTRIQTVSYGVIGFFGLVLAAIGLAGVTAYAVAQRTKEIGIRVALGATRFQVLRVVSREGAFLVIAGIVIGEAIAMGLTGILNAWYAQLYEITRTSTSDPLILIGTPLLLSILTMLSCYIPARRAIRIDPVSALRQD
jgi:predicted permease